MPETFEWILPLLDSTGNSTGNFTAFRILPKFTPEKFEDGQDPLDKDSLHLVYNFFQLLARFSVCVSVDCVYTLQSASADI